MPAHDLPAAFATHPDVGHVHPVRDVAPVEPPGLAVAGDEHGGVAVELGVHLGLEDRVEDAEREAAVVVAGDARSAEADVVLLGLLRVEDQAVAPGRLRGTYENNGYTYQVDFGIKAQTAGASVTVTVALPVNSAFSVSVAVTVNSPTAAGVTTADPGPRSRPARGRCCRIGGSGPAADAGDQRACDRTNRQRAKSRPRC